MQEAVNKRPMRYMLDGKNVRPVVDEADKRLAVMQQMSGAYTIATDYCYPYAVETIFLMIDHNHDVDDPTPILFETSVHPIAKETVRWWCFDLMTFDKGKVLEYWRTGTYKEAEQAHKDAVKMLRGDTSPGVMQRLKSLWR